MRFNACGGGVLSPFYSWREKKAENEEKKRLKIITQTHKVNDDKAHILLMDVHNVKNYRNFVTRSTKARERESKKAHNGI